MTLWHRKPFFVLELLRSVATILELYMLEATLPKCSLSALCLESMLCVQLRKPLDEEELRWKCRPFCMASISW